jgi:hypothetical protein
MKNKYERLKGNTGRLALFGAAVFGLFGRNFGPNGKDGYNGGAR